MVMSSGIWRASLRTTLTSEVKSRDHEGRRSSNNKKNDMNNKKGIEVVINDNLNMDKMDQIILMNLMQDRYHQLRHKHLGIKPYLENGFQDCRCLLHKCQGIRTLRLGR